MTLVMRILPVPCLHWIPASAQRILEYNAHIVHKVCAEMQISSDYTSTNYVYEAYCEAGLAHALQ